MAAGDRLPVGPPNRPMASVDVAPVAEPTSGEVVVRISPGPRRDWFPDDAWARLADSPVTGGYPVIAYVDDDALDECAQLRPGQALRFRV